MFELSFEYLSEDTGRRAIQGVPPPVFDQECLFKRKLPQPKEKLYLIIVFFSVKVNFLKGNQANITQSR